MYLWPWYYHQKLMEKRLKNKHHQIVYIYFFTSNDKLQVQWKAKISVQNIFKIMGELFTRFYKMFNKSIKTKLIIIRTYIIWHIHDKLSSIFWLYLLHGRRSYQVNIFIERNNFSMYQLCKMMVRSPQLNYRFWYIMKSTRRHK